MVRAELSDIPDDRWTAPDSPAREPGFSAGMLWRSKWLMLCTFVLICGATIPYVWLFLPPTYDATAIVRVSPVVTRIVFKTEDNGIVPLYRSYLNTQVSIIRSPNVLERVLDREDVRRTKWYQSDELVIPGSAPPNPIERLREALSIRPRRNTELIDVSIVTQDASDAKVLVDSVVDEYRRYVDESAKETNLRRFETLRNEQVSLQREIDGLVATKFNLSNRLGTTGPEELRLLLTTHLNTLEAERAALERQLALAQWEMDMRKSSVEDEGIAADGSTGAVSNQAVQRYSEDPEWRGLNIQAETIRHDLALARQQFGEAHPMIEQLVSSVGHAERLLRQREAQLEVRWEEGPFQARSVSNSPVVVVGAVPIDRQAKRLARHVELFGGEIDGQRRKVAEAGEIAKQIAQYNEEIRYKRELYDAVRSRIAQLELESNAPARISVAAHAVQPSKPSRDRRLLLTGMSVCLAMMAALGVGYIRISLDSKIRGPGEVRYAVHAPFLGQLPPLPPSVNLMLDASPLLMESVRMVRTALLERLDQDTSNVVLVTSASSRAGKTSFAVLLARSLAMLGRRTLLVEADLRRPSLAQRLSLDSESGLAALLMGSTADESVIVRSSVDKLDILVAGELPEHFSAELLANGVLSRCLGRWKESYDFVLLDSPPVLPVADARILSSQADGTILVLRSSHCRRAEVAQACTDLTDAGGRLVGAVLVGVPIGSVYGAYGDYQSYGVGTRVLEKV